MRVFHGFSQVGDFCYKVIPSIIQSMGRTPLSQSIEIQNLAKSLLSNVELVWKDEFRQWDQNKVAIETTYIPHARVSEFLQGEWRDMQTAIEWDISKDLSLQQDVKKLTIKNHLGHTWYGFKTYKPFPLVIFASSKVSCFCVFWFHWMQTMFCRYECGYGLKDH